MEETLTSRIDTGAGPRCVALRGCVQPSTKDRAESPQSRVGSKGSTARGAPPEPRTSDQRLSSLSAGTGKMLPPGKHLRNGCFPLPSPLPLCPRRGKKPVLLRDFHTPPSSHQSPAQAAFLGSLGCSAADSLSGPCHPACPSCPSYMASVPLKHLQPLQTLISTQLAVSGSWLQSGQLRLMWSLGERTSG